MKKENSKGIGCLGWLILIILICFAITLYSYCWIPAIGVLIYCIKSKKYEAYKRRNVAICIVVIITSLMTFGWLNAPSELESISADWEQTEFDVTETTEVSIRTTPSDAEIESLELSENDFAELDYTDGKAVITFKSPGKATLYFTANDDVDSNEVTITVTDKAAEKAAAEAKAKEEAEKAAAEAQAQAEAEAAAQAQAEAESQAAAQAQAEAEAQAAAQAQQPQGEMVWIPQTGSKYHSNSSCSNMKNPTQVTISEAQSRGYEPCKKCY